MSELYEMQKTSTVLSCGHRAYTRNGRWVCAEMQCCSTRSDGTHCVHWWDAEAPCCTCGDNTGYAEAQAGMDCGRGDGDTGRVVS